MCTDTHRCVRSRASSRGRPRGSSAPRRRERAGGRPAVWTRGLLQPSRARGRSASGRKDAKGNVNESREQRQRRGGRGRPRSSRRVWPCRCGPCLPCAPAHRRGSARVHVVPSAHRGGGLCSSPPSPPPWASIGSPGHGCPQRWAQVTPPERGHGCGHSAGAPRLPAPARGTRRTPRAAGRWLVLVLAVAIDKGLPSKSQADPLGR